MVLACGVVAVGSGSHRAWAGQSDADVVARARAIHERVLTLDTHDDISPANFTSTRNYTMDLPTQVNLPKMVAGGLDVAWLVVFVGQGDLTTDGYAAAYSQAIEKFEAIHRLTTELAPGQVELALTATDARRIVAEGKKAVMIGVENGYPIGREPGRVREFAERGARYLSLAHNGHNQLADSHTGEADDVWSHNGLSELGRQIVFESNRWGLMLDLSHPSKAANLETMALSRAPVIASHSAARAINDHSRNLDDEQLVALKATGGVVQTVAFRGYLHGPKNAAHQRGVRAVVAAVARDMEFDLIGGGRGREMFVALEAMSQRDRDRYMEEFVEVEAAAARRVRAEVDPITPPVGVTDLVDHVDYLVTRLGIDHVGISSDFDGGGGVTGWSDASETFNVTLELVRRGYTEEQIELLWSGNLLRVLDEVQAVAAEMQADTRR